jgi:hypothetical protein
VLTTNLHYVRALFNPYLLGEVCLHDDVDAKEALNKVLWKITHTPIAYAQVLKDVIDFVKSKGLFSNTPSSQGLVLTPTQVVGFD